MTDTSNGGPRIAIFDSRRVLLHESVGAAFGDRSLKHIINTLRTVQRETNEFLTKLVNEQTSQPSQNAAKNESATEDKDSADEEDDGDEDEDESACPKKRRQQ